MKVLFFEQNVCCHIVIESDGDNTQQIEILHPSTTLAQEMF